MVTIFADTSSSIPVQVAKDLGIEYLPQIIVFGEQSYRDDYELDSHTFIEKLKASATLPQTSAPPPALYKPLLEKHIQNGDEIIILTPSAHVSGTYRSAKMASQEFPDAKIMVLDTLNIGASFATIVLRANKWAKQGLPADAIIPKVQNLIGRERNLFVVDTLEYLHKGGRIGGASMLIGSLIQMKPLLSLRKGKVEPVEKIRTKTKALSRFIEIVSAECPRDSSCMLSVQHGNALQDAQQLAEDFKSILNVDKVSIYDLPPAFLVHSGPGVLGVSYFVEK